MGLRLLLLLPLQPGIGQGLAFRLIGADPRKPSASLEAAFLPDAGEDLAVLVGARALAVRPPVLPFALEAVAVREDDDPVAVAPIVLEFAFEAIAAHKANDAMAVAVIVLELAFEAIAVLPCEDGVAIGVALDELTLVAVDRTAVLGPLEHPFAVGQAVVAGSAPGDALARHRVRVPHPAAVRVGDPTRLRPGRLLRLGFRQHEHGNEDAQCNPPHLRPFFRQEHFDHFVERGAARLEVRAMRSHLHAGFSVSTQALSAPLRKHPLTQLPEKTSPF